MLISTISYNAIPFTTVFSQFFTFLLLSSHLLHATVCIIKSFLCHDIKQAMSYHIMEFYVMICRMSRLSQHPYWLVQTTTLLEITIQLVDDIDHWFSYVLWQFECNGASFLAISPWKMQSSTVTYHFVAPHHPPPSTPI